VGKKSGSGDEQPGSYFRKLWVKVLTFFDADPGFGLKKFRSGMEGSGINIPDPQH
jgi:hypothetical protein